MSDRWNAAEAYEGFMGRWSRPLAARFVEWLGLPAGIRWAGALPVRDRRFESVSSSLALNFFPDPEAAVEGMLRCVVAGGCVSASVWDYADGMELLRWFWKVATDMDRDAAAFDERARFPLTRPEALDHLFRTAGLHDVRGNSIEIDMEFPGFEDLWRPLLGGTGPAPSYVATLDEHGRSVLARELERALPLRSNGAIRLRARAWAVRGMAGEAGSESPRRD